MRQNFAVVLVAAILLFVGGLLFQYNQIEKPRHDTIPNTPTVSPAPFAAKSWTDSIYITPVDWPPKINTTNASYSCAPAGQPEARAGKTEEKVIGGRKYCVTQVMEGAAGSIYHQFAYATQVGQGKTAILTFSIRQVQCANYPSPKNEECQKEQASFDVDKAILPELQKLSQ